MTSLNAVYNLRIIGLNDCVNRLQLVHRLRSPRYCHSKRHWLLHRASSCRRHRTDRQFRGRSPIAI